MPNICRLGLKSAIILITPLLSQIPALGCTLSGFVQGEYTIYSDHNTSYLFSVKQFKQGLEYETHDTLTGFCSNLSRGPGTCDLSHFVSAATAIQLCGILDQLTTVSNDKIAKDSIVKIYSQDILQLSKSIDAITQRLDMLQSAIEHHQ
jgi:hypothetical protein